MSYLTQHYPIDLLRDYMNGATEPEAWEELRAFALDILDAYAERHDTPDNVRCVDSLVPMVPPEVLTDA